jgi:hypothetical protein
MTIKLELTHEILLNARIEPYNISWQSRNCKGLTITIRYVYVNIRIKKSESRFIHSWFIKKVRRFAHWNISFTSYSRFLICKIDKRPVWKLQRPSLDLLEWLEMLWKVRPTLGVNRLWIFLLTCKSFVNILVKKVALLILGLCRIN